MPSRKTPSERGYRQVILSPDAYGRLKGVGGSASASVMKLTSRVEQLEADLAAIRGELERLKSDGAPSEDWLVYAFGRRKMMEPKSLDARNAWRRIANLPEEKPQEWE